MQTSITLRTSSGKSVPGTRIRVQSCLPASREAIWAQLTTVGSLRFVCKPWVFFCHRGKSPLGNDWKTGDVFPFFLWLYGILPGGRHTIRLEKIDRSNHAIQSRESGAVVSVWDHLITLHEVSANETLYTDQVDLYAGRFTPVVAWWAIRFYQHRQGRWVALLERS